MLSRPLSSSKLITHKPTLNADGATHSNVEDRDAADDGVIHLAIHVRVVHSHSKMTLAKRRCDVVAVVIYSSHVHVSAELSEYR